MKAWDGEEGCPAWIEQTVGSKENPMQPELRKQCLELWKFDLQWSMLGALEGNQQAVESFRNGMVQVDGQGTVHPKADPALLKLVHIVQEQIKKQEIIHDHESKKLLEEEKDIKKL